MAVDDGLVPDVVVDQAGGAVDAAATTGRRPAPTGDQLLAWAMSMTSDHTSARSAGGPIGSGETSITPLMTE